MVTLKGIALAGSAAFGAPWFFRGAQPAATVILSHRYFSANEPRTHSRDRLRHQLEWLQRTYNPISIPELLHGLAKGTVPDNSIVVTTDDAHLDVYEVAEEFRGFGVPLAVFVCVGWVSSIDCSEDDLLARAVSSVQWYEGIGARINLGDKFSFELSSSTKATNIDWILRERTSMLPYLEELCIRINALKINALAGHAPRRTICNWSELHELASSGVYIGAHSVSHVAISQMSEVRRHFEIMESKRVIQSKIGSCTAFAYPFGMRGTYNKSTLAELKASGFEGAFTTLSDFLTVSSPTFELPRIALPDAPMPLYEFKARVRGGGIPLRKLKGLAW